ncbi:MAG: hypothetical protein K2H18_03950 [Muribaculaceae bacterium]|nr:hypothetical protein [Muribaculaceae bacterium]
MNLNTTNENFPISIEFKKDYERLVFDEYSSEENPFKSRIQSDKQIEEALKSDYSGRELYEIIQNADDAKASVIEIELDAENRLHIRNNGDCPFTNKGIRSVMRPHQSSKLPSTDGGDTIGNKGLGIRSLLNWSNGITIHSNGVKLEFSNSIACRRWEEILLKTPSLKPLETDGVSPLPILSVPMVSVDDVTESGNKGEWTTEIEILCNSNVIHDVKSKIEGLHAEILLFLRNIRKITFKIEGDKKIDLIRRSSESIQIDGIDCEKINLQEAETKFSYLLHSTKVNIPIKHKNHESIEGEVSVGFSIDTERTCEYLFSYFPTEIPLNLPCALHADFELTMSRNALVKNEFNSRLMEVLAKTLMISAVLRGKLIMQNGSSNRLLPLQMLTLGETVSQTMPEFAARVDREFDSYEVIPTIDNSYKTFSDGVYYSTGVEMADFISKINGRSLLNNYIDRETNIILQKNNREPRKINSLYAELSELASDLSVEENAELIIRLLNVTQWTVKPSVIRLDSTKMADPETTSYVLVSKDVSSAINQGQEMMNVVPAELHLNIIHPLLSKLLQKKLDTDPRGLTKDLRKIATVSDADFSRVKQEIETKSSRLSIDELNGVILWLYNRWKKYDNGKDSDAPVCYKFKLFNDQGERRQVCSLLLYSDKPEFKLNESHLNMIPQDDQKAFFIDYLGISEALPVTDCYFGKDSDYITDVLGSEWIQRVQNATPELNVALIPCENYIRSMSIEDILTLILSDRRFLQHIYESKEIYYSYYGEKTRYANQSYSAYWLTHYDHLLSGILNYVIPRTPSLDFSILNEGILDIDKISGASSQNIFDLLKQLGAKYNPIDLTFAQLYQLLENQTDASKALRNYREIRFVIKEKMDIQNQKPLENDLNILKSVWAKGADGEIKRMPKEEVYYWDNSRLPKRFLDSLWKLMLPSRTGEKSVSEIFGVKLLSNLNLAITHPDDYNEPLSEDVKHFLFNRLKYLVAISLTGGEYKLDTIRQKNNDIKGFMKQLRLAESVSYKCRGKVMEAVDGDIINSGDHIFICTSLSTLEDVLKSPMICSNIAKGLCMKLKVGADNEVRFLHVIQSSDETLEYEWNELDKSIRDEIDSVIGLLELEKLFWSILGVPIDDTDADPVSRRKKIISTHPEIKIPDPLVELKDFSELEFYNLLFSLDREDREKVSQFISLENFYKSQLEAERCRLSLRYKAATFKKWELIINSNHSIESVHTWLRKLSTFDEVVRQIMADQNTDIIIELEQLVQRFNNAVRREFPLINQFNREESPKIKPQYEAILHRYNVALSELNYSEQAIGFFDGFEDEFETLVSSKTIDPEINSNNDPLIKDNGGYSFTRSDKKSGKSSSGNGGFTNSQTKDKIGKNAEMRVREYLESNPDLYDSVTDVSQRHEMHCDLMYRRKNDLVLRYLEVKSVNGKKINFSPGEIEQGKANSEIYDLALVYGDCVKIIPHAFKQNSELMTNIIPSGYEINFETIP